MTEFSPNAVRLIFFLFFLILFGSLEKLFPRRAPHGKIKDRWPGNFLVVFTDSLLLKMIFPIGATGMALWLQHAEIGLLNLLPVPEWLNCIITILALDLVIYWQHRLFHRNHILWKLHRMHHTDIDLDVSSALRFHPLEICISFLIKIAFITALGSHIEGVLVFEIILSSTALFNHANMSIPRPIDQILRYFIVTPDMHRTHHTTRKEEQNSNFGFNLPWWDFLFKSYRNQSLEDPSTVVLGTKNFRSPKDHRFVSLLIQPFVNKTRKD
ncbi:MAG: sterol desaturase family protein [Bdellovibrionales bacterium]|nr:sterol desaturase family protein [Bdellovibrionales bacterium]